MTSARHGYPDPIGPCPICCGHRILVDICGESVCGWCDGTGLATNEDHTQAELADLVSERLRTL